MTFTPRHEEITGADLTGSSPSTNRTYTLTNSNAVLEQMQIIIANIILQANIDFTFDTDTLLVTFLNTVWDDQNISIDYMTNDTTSTVSYLQDSYSISGSDLTGSDGATNRTFIFINNQSITGANMQVTVDNTVLQQGVDFTFNSTTKTITFLNATANSSSISIDYFYVGNTYCSTPLEVAQISGIGIAIQLEELGTGDGANRSFDTENPNILQDSYTVYYGESGNNSNQLSILEEGTDYQIAIDDGRIYLFESGVTKLSTNLLYISYTYSPQQSNTVLVNYLTKAGVEVEKITGNYWGSPKQSIEYFDGYTSGYPQTDKPYGNQIENLPEFELKNKGVSVSTTPTVEFLDFTGSVSGDVDSTYVQWDEDGRILVGPYTIPNGKRNVKITYTHGYDETPELIQELCALVSGLMALVNISGGSYKDVSTYTLGRKTFSIGQVYVNIESSIKQMNARIESILDMVGRNYWCV